MSRPMLDAATAYTRRGWRVVPIREGEKRPPMAGWEALRLEEKDLPLHFNGRGGLGLLLGDPSGGVVDVDVDALEALRCAPLLLPKTNRRHGRASKPGSHYWYLVEVPTPKTLRLRDPEGGDTLIELRGTGGQTVAPPSAHPSGELLAWEAEGEPRASTYSDLVRCVRGTAAACLLARAWPAQGGRHDAALALAGVLLRGGMEEKRAERFVRAVAVAAGDDEGEDRVTAVSTTAATLRDGGAATGWPRALEMFGEARLRKAAEWLALRAGSDFDARASDTKAEETADDEEVAEWPEPLDDAAMIGPLGELVRVIAPHTEADPAALLLQAMTAFGSVIGRTAYYVAESDKHYANVNVVLVGATSKGRKGTSWGRIKAPFGEIDAAWSENCVKSGLSSGEGLIYHVRDGEEHPDEDASDGKRTRGKGASDPGVSDKRLLILESEFASVLRVMERQGNTLSAVVREAWDSGRLSTLTKNSPTKATGAHVSIIGHITVDELRRYLDRTEAGNGFGNRFLWACVKRGNVLPFGGDLRAGALVEAGRQLAEAVRRAQALAGAPLGFDPEARELWGEKYEALSDARPGLLGAVVGRAEAQTVRLALLYALADCSPVIRLRHLAAALEVWRYCGDSAAFVFGNSLGDPLADELLRLLQGAAEGVSRDGMREHFGRHRRSGEIERALRVLAGAGLARMEDRQTGGRPEERWHAVRVRGKRHKRGMPPLTALTAQPEPRLTALTALTAQPEPAREAGLL